MRFRNLPNHVDSLPVLEEWSGRWGEDLRGKETPELRDILLCLVSGWDYVGPNSVCTEEDPGAWYRQSILLVRVLLKSELSFKSVFTIPRLKMFLIDDLMDESWYRYSRFLTVCMPFIAVFDLLETQLKLCQWDDLCKKNTLRNEKGYSLVFIEYSVYLCKEK